MKWYHLLLICVAVVGVAYGVAYSRHYIPQLASIFQMIPVGDSNVDYMLTTLEGNVASALGGNLETITPMLGGGLGLASAGAAYFRNKNIAGEAEKELNEAGLLGQINELTGQRKELEDTLTAQMNDLQALTEEQAAAITIKDGVINEKNESLTKTQQQIIDLQQELKETIIERDDLRLANETSKIYSQN